MGDLTLAYEGLNMEAEPGLTLTIYTAEPGSPSEERLKLLGSWNEPAHTTRAHGATPMRPSPPHADG